jgi:hypothetical protein
VEIIGQNPFLGVKSVKHIDTSEDITERFVSKDGDFSWFWALTKNLEWIPQ